MIWNQALKRRAGLDEEEDMRGFRREGDSVNKEPASLGEQRVEGAKEGRRAGSVVSCRKEYGTTGSFLLAGRNESWEAVTVTEACLSRGWAKWGRLRKQKAVTSGDK